MNRKQLIIVIVLGVVLGGLGLYVSRRNAASYQSGGAGLGGKVLAGFPVNDVTHIVIKETTNELNLVKEGDDWKVRERYNYPANFQEIGDFVRKVWDLKAVQTEPVAASELAGLELVEPGKGANSGTLVGFKDKGGKTLASLLLGKKHMKKSESSSQFGGEGWPDGRYVMVPGGSKNVALISDPLTDAESNPEHWLNKDFFKVEKSKSVAVAFPDATNSWKLSRETENGVMQLADAKPDEQLDTSKAAGAGNVFGSPSFVDVVSPQAKLGETGLDKPAIATIETFDGFVYTARIGSKTTNGDNYYFNVGVSANLPKERTPGKDEKPEDKAKLDKEFKDKLAKWQEKLKQEEAFEKWTYLVANWTVEPLLKTRKELLVEKKPEAKPETKPATTDSPHKETIPDSPPGLPKQ